MKKNYQAPSIHVVAMTALSLMAGSVSTNLDGFVGYGGSQTEGEID